MAAKERKETQRTECGRRRSDVPAGHRRLL